MRPDEIQGAASRFRHQVQLIKAMLYQMQVYGRGTSEHIGDERYRIHDGMARHLGNSQRIQSLCGKTVLHFSVDVADFSGKLCSVECSCLPSLAPALVKRSNPPDMEHGPIPAAHDVLEPGLRAGGDGTESKRRKLRCCPRGDGRYNVQPDQGAPEEPKILDLLCHDRFVYGKRQILMQDTERPFGQVEFRKVGRRAPVIHADTCGEMGFPRTALPGEKLVDQW